MKTSLYLIASVMLVSSLGCSMCSHPFDYNYAAFDEAQMSGQRAGSAFAPYSSSSHTVVSEPVPAEPAGEGEMLEEEVMYYDSANP
ncbi:hypothetical protein [Blastopirellula marina]|nr:hypothetical protein [Blastopirellula marina]